MCLLLKELQENVTWIMKEWLGHIPNMQYPLKLFTTLTSPPPGSWPTLSMDPTLDLALALTILDSIFTSLPPERDQSWFTWIFIAFTHNETAFTVTGNIKKLIHPLPCLCFMLSLDPHLEVTFLKSTFLFKIWTWRPSVKTLVRLKCLLFLIIDV